MPSWRKCCGTCWYSKSINASAKLECTSPIVSSNKNSPVVVDFDWDRCRHYEDEMIEDEIERKKNIEIENGGMYF